MTVQRACQILLLISFFLPFVKCTCFLKKEVPSEVSTTDSVAVSIPEQGHVDSLSPDIEVDTNQISAQDSVKTEINDTEEQRIDSIETALNNVFEVFKVILCPPYYPESRSAFFFTYSFLSSLLLDKLDWDSLFYHAGLMLSFLMVVISVLLSFTKFYKWLRILIMVGFICYLPATYFLYREPCFEILYGFWITTALFVVSALSSFGFTLPGVIQAFARLNRK